jgi:hypothetical protein
MKGIIMSAVLWMHMIVLIVGMIWLVNFEMTRHHVVNAHKQALRSTIQLCLVADCNRHDAMNLFTLFIEPSLNRFDHASWRLMGFNERPMLIRFEVSVNNNRSWFPIYINSDEAMIQETYYE